jgi:hypothetical protein
MILRFAATEIRFSAGCSTPGPFYPHPEKPGHTPSVWTRTSLGGFSTISKPDSGDSPPLDDAFPPSAVHAMRISRIPLPTSLYFVAVRDWHKWCRDRFEILQAVFQLTGKAFDKVLEVVYDAPSLVWYDEDRDEPGAACLRIDLWLPHGDLGALNQWLSLAAADKIRLPTIDFDDFLFMPTRAGTEKTGIPTWDDFLGGKMPALPAGYTINFRREQRREPASPRTSGVGR